MVWYRLLIFVILVKFGCPHAMAQDKELEDLISEIKQSKNVVEGRFFVGEELVFSITVDKYKIGQVNAIVLESGIAFDFESYTTVFDFPIMFDPTTSRYKGWFIKEENTFSFDHLSPNQTNKSLTAMVNEKKIIVHADSYMFDNDTLFLRQEIFTEFFQIDHQVDYGKLQVKVTSALRLPFLQQLTRRKGASLSNQGRQANFVNLPRSYELLSPQILDAQFGSIYRDQEQSFVTSYAIQGARDIALWHSQFSISGNDTNKIANSRLNFSRQSVKGDLFGNTGITKFEVGDVRDVRQGTGQFLSESMGVRLGNTDISNRFDADIIVIEGDILTGWDVELYRNNVLLRQEFDNQTGRYNFLDIPLIFGQNNFEIVLYGPQGQVKRRTIEKLLDESTFSNKDFTYEVSLTDTNNTLFDNSNFNNLSDPGYNFSGRAKFYILDMTSLDFGLRSQFGGDNNNNVLNLGLNSVIFDDVLLSTYADINDSNLLNVYSNVRTQWKQQSLSFQARLSDATDVFNRKEVFLTAGIDGDLHFADSFRIPLSQQIGYRENEDARTYYYSNRLGFRFGRFSLFNTYTFEVEENNDGYNTTRQVGNLSLQANLGNVFARAGIIYSPKETESISTSQASVNWNINKEYRASLVYTQDYVNDNDTVSSQFSYIGDGFRVSARVGNSDSRGLDVGINASFSLSGQDQKLDRVEQSSNSQTNSGSLAVRVFLDNNLNSVFDADDVLLPDVEVKALQFFKSAITDQSGVALLSRLTNLQTSDIVINRDTLPDSFMRPRLEGVSITSRSGLADFLDYPVVPASEINGIIELIQNEEVKTGSNIELVLIDANGRMIGSTKSEYDGFYSFLDIMPGKYKIMVKKESSERFDLEAIDSHRIIVPTLPDIITFDIKANVKQYQEVYISQISTIKNERLVPLALVNMRQKLKYVDAEVYAYKGAKSPHYSFFTASDSNVENIEFICEAMRLNNINCEPIKISLN
jgi:PHP family Zn ribbon phosphoesterase